MNKTLSSSTWFHLVIIILILLLIIVIRSNQYINKTFIKKDFIQRIGSTTVHLNDVIFMNSICSFNSHRRLTVIRRILLVHKTELFEPLLLWRGVINDGTRLLIRLTSSAADHTVDSTVQDVEALLDNDASDAGKYLLQV